MNTLPNTPKIGGGILAIDIQTGDILLGRRGGVSTTSNKFAPFGGTFEIRDGNPKVTAKREFMEESGSGDNFKISATPFYVNRDNHLTFYTYIGLFNGKFPVHLSNESLGYTWAQLDNLPGNLLPGVAQMFRDKHDELKVLINKLVLQNKESQENI